MYPSSECDVQRVLREKYNAALITYWEMVTALERASTSQDFQETFERAEGVRLLFAAARLDLENHIREHGCLIPAQEEAAGAA
jgi:hypothetical protein